MAINLHMPGLPLNTDGLIVVAVYIQRVILAGYLMPHQLNAGFLIHFAEMVLRTGHPLEFFSGLDSSKREGRAEVIDRRNAQAVRCGAAGRMWFDNAIACSELDLTASFVHRL